MAKPDRPSPASRRPLSSLRATMIKPMTIWRRRDAHLKKTTNPTRIVQNHQAVRHSWKVLSDSPRLLQFLIPISHLFWELSAQISAFKNPWPRPDRSCGSDAHPTTKTSLAFMHDSLKKERSYILAWSTRLNDHRPKRVAMDFYDWLWGSD